MSAASKNSSFSTIENLKRDAEQYVREHWQEQTADKLGPVLAIEFNHGLDEGCPALEKYCKGYDALKQTPWIEKTMFAWHGTPSVENIAAICHYGFDPGRRTRQKFSTGEYFGVTASNSCSYTGSTSRLILVQILMCVHVTSHMAGCHVVNNPNTGTCALNLPVLLVTYHNRSPPAIPWIQGPKCTINAPFSAPRFTIRKSLKKAQTWYWTNDGHLQLLDPAVNRFLEEHFKRSHDTGGVVFATSPIMRYDNEQLQPFNVVFHKTSKVTPGAETMQNPDAKYSWFWKDGDKAEPYPVAISDIIECYFQDFNLHNGSHRFRTPGIVRKNDNVSQRYTIDFSNFTQINTKSGFVRHIERKWVVSNALVGEPMEVDME